MKNRLFLLMSTMLTVLFCSAQNVGIGTATPAEKLDVNGNVKVSGSINANGSLGSAGQVLMKDNSNNLVWNNIGDYKNVAFFGISGSSTWTVPAGVTTVVAEVWGGGGGGQLCGGGSGGYISIKLDVTPSTTVSIQVGAGGILGSNGVAGTTGGSSSLTYGAIIATAFGGIGGSFGSPSYYPGLGGDFTVTPATFINYVAYKGLPGKGTAQTYFQINSTNFGSITHYGNGGDAIFFPGTGADGGIVMRNETTFTTIGFTDATIRPNGPGAGGGGSSSYGYYGNSGRVIIHY